MSNLERTEWSGFTEELTVRAQYLNELLDDCLEEGLQQSWVSHSCIGTDAPANVVALASRSSNEGIEQQGHPILGKLPESCHIPVGINAYLALQLSL